MSQPNYASPVDLSEGGSLYDQCWLKITAAKTEITSKFSKPTPVLVLTGVEDGSGAEHTEMFMAGSADNWDADGKWFIPKTTFKGKAPKLSKLNSLGEMLGKIEEAGFTWDLNTFANTGCQQLVGHYFWVDRYELTDRDGNPIPQKKDGQDTGFNKTGIMFTKWGGNGAQPNEAAGAAVAAQPQQAASAPTVDNAAIEAAVVTQIATGKTAHHEIVTALATTPPAGVDLGAMMPLIAVGSAWMSDAARPWTLTNGVLATK